VSAMFQRATHRSGACSAARTLDVCLARIRQAPSSACVDLARNALAGEVRAYILQRQARDREQVRDVRDLRPLSSLGAV
jgi:hypothetical protein